MKSTNTKHILSHHKLSYSAKSRQLLVGSICLGALFLTLAALAATNPSAGTVSPVATVINFTGGPFSASNPSDPVGMTPPVCTDSTCGQFALTVDIPADTNTYNVNVNISWTNSGTTTQQSQSSDYDLYIYKPDVTGAAVAQSASSSNPESTTFKATAGTYTIYVVPYDVSPTVAFNGRITLSTVASPTPTPIPTPTPRLAPGTARYTVYQSPPGFGDSSGEPSIGVNWNTGKVMYFGGFAKEALRITFDDCPSPARATWEKTPLTLAATTRELGDPILFTDHETGRTFVSQLEGGTKQSTTDYSDDDGNTYQPSQGSGINSGYDHQTFGGGPFAPGMSGINGYKNAVYYCSQDDAYANCALSVDGGITFGPAVPIYTAATCGGIHGHVKVGTDGTVYVPNKSCGGQAAVVLSEDNGITWTVRPLPGSTNGSWDPSVGVATDGTIYLGYNAADNHARVAYSHDKGKTWSQPFDVGSQLGIQNTVFPAVVAGDRDRAAYAFYGTTTGGNYDNSGFDGVWYLYIATTFDGGQTWTTLNATPNDPVQRGRICASGTLCAAPGGGGNTRNLDDFFDATVDKEGRVLVGYDDGCITQTCINGGGNDFTAKAAIARQSGGKRMFAMYDPIEPGVPGAPSVTATRDSSNTFNHLTWPQPDDNGAPITAYNIYRGTDGLTFNLVASVPETSFDDHTVAAGQAYYYQVTAVNSYGEGPHCAPVAVSGTYHPSSCDLPGMLVISDLNSNGSDNDQAPNAPADARANIRQVFVAEPYLGTGLNKLIFTMQMAPSTVVPGAPPSTQWFVIWNRLNPDANFDRYYVAMKSDVTGAVSFEYGRFGVLLDSTNPNPNANTPVKLGVPDSGTFDPQTGVIRITLSTANAENIQPGQHLASINARTFLGQPDAGLKSQTYASDITTNGDYQLIGNAACRVNAPPTAQLFATPLQGNAPLTVNFDASGSSDSDGKIASYTFDFNDGSSAVTQASPSISHIYKTAGNYTATLRVTDTQGAVSNNVASAMIQVAPPAPTTECIEDDDARVSYTNGWHLGSSSSASAGHFRYDTGSSPQQNAALDFSVPANQTGAITYIFARSTKGGSADVYLDGVLKQSINYSGTAGSMKSPDFNKSYQVRYAGLTSGAHKLEIRNLNGVVYVDGFCLESSSSNAQPASGPGQTANGNTNVGSGGQASSSYKMPANAQAVSVVAESNLGVPFQLVLVDPSGVALQTVNASSGLATINRAVTPGGIYAIKVINLGVGPLQISTTTTPLVAR
jgi:PKD repeat protein